MSFENEADREKFMELIGGTVVNAKMRGTWSIWWPEKPRGDNTEVEFVEADA